MLKLNVRELNLIQGALIEQAEAIEKGKENQVRRFGFDSESSKQHLFDTRSLIQKVEDEIIEQQTVTFNRDERYR